MFGGALADDAERGAKPARRVENLRRVAPRLGHAAHVHALTDAVRGRARTSTRARVSLARIVRRGRVPRSRRASQHRRLRRARVVHRLLARRRGHGRRRARSRERTIRIVVIHAGDGDGDIRAGDGVGTRGAVGAVGAILLAEPRAEFTLGSVVSPGTERGPRAVRVHRRRVRRHRVRVRRRRALRVDGSAEERPSPRRRSRIRRDGVAHRGPQRANDDDVVVPDARARRQS